MVLSKMQFQRPNQVWVARAFWALFFGIVAVCLWRYFAYLSAVIPLNYDWEASDGDHLNFAHRLAQGLPIYFSSLDGQFLSIYNPLYHAVVALLGGDDASMVLARSLALIFWLLCPLIAYWYARNKWGRFYAVVAAVCILLPPQPRMLFEIVSINGNSLMACLFLLTLISAELLQRKTHKSWVHLTLLGGVAALCYFAKQQGLVAIATITVYLLIKERKIGIALWCALGFALTAAIAVAYLEFANHGNFLKATVFDLSQVMTSSALMANKRLIQFFIKNWAFTIVSIMALYWVIRKRDALNVWHVSFVMHIPLLLKILGNEGGGETYFLTFWITVVMMVFSFVMKNITTSSDYSDQQMIEAGPKLSWGMFFLCLNVAVGASHSIAKSLGEISMPSQALDVAMREYYGAVQLLVGQRQNQLALTNRNTGALVNSRVQSENEGCTTFGYAWQRPEFDRDILLDAIRAKKYDLISTGLTPYPKDVSNEIESNYRSAFTMHINFNRGREGDVTVYTRK